MPHRQEIRVFPDLPALSRAAASEFVERSREAIRDRDRFAVVLSGGSTPKTLYELLGKDPGIKGAVEWEKVHFFFSDERHVPPDHPDSNYGMATRALFASIAAPPANIHRFLTEQGDAAGAAASYERMLREFFHLEAGGFPRFDLIFLGLGAEAHTASLFPGGEALREAQKLAVAAWVPSVAAWRITLTVPVLNSAQEVMFLVSGTAKAQALQEVLEGTFEPNRWPAQAVKPEQGRLIFLADEEAARWLSRA